MPLDDAGMHRVGLAFLYRITPVLVATVLFGVYIALLCIVTRGLFQRGISHPANALITLILYAVFVITAALWALEVAQLMGLVSLLLHPNDLSTDAKFTVFYNLIARETKLTGVLFKCQMILGDVLVMWRVAAIWYDRRVFVFIPIFWWGLMIVNMIVSAIYCRSGVNSTNYTVLCKTTDVLAPVLSIMTNVSVMLLTLWRAWLLRKTLVASLRTHKKNKTYTLFVLLIESGTLYVIMLVADLLVTSLVLGGPESVGRMIDCISGYSAVQFVGIYPTLMLVVIRESVWNAPDESLQIMSVSRLHLESGNLGPGRKHAAVRENGSERSFASIRFASSDDTSTAVTNAIVD
ncbi:hypothetical protein LshimejAT787_0411140 [Lyophyllum shimeji]|uniref:Uncharacterized protein n=1 Tax=Lyophyllum shimeji TaxID=47721 RepID=A0A9P3ULW3_LYOSH|nr:hypothetical protein LshimejAT787_0411140 [Lyophyllum shimeji]